MNYITRAFTLHMSGVQYWSAFQSSNLIGWVEVNLGCCQGNGAYAVYNRYPRMAQNRTPKMGPQTSPHIPGGYLGPWVPKIL